MDTTQVSSTYSGTEIFNWVILGLLGLLVLIGALKGLRRGISRQLIRTATVIASVVIAILVAKYFADNVLAKTCAMTTEEIIASLDASGSLSPEMTNALAALDSATISYILAIPLGLILSPIIFVILFVAISGLMLIVHAILSGIFGFSKKRNNALTRVLGMVLGALQGALVTIVLLVPVVGLLTSATETVAMLNRESPEDESTVAIVEVYTESVKDYAEHPLVTAMSSVGGKLIYNKLATVKLEGEDYQMVETVSRPAVKISMNVIKLKGFDWKKLTDENEAAIKDIIAALEESSYTSALTADLLTFVSELYEEGGLMAEIEAPMSDIMDAAMQTIGSFTDESVATDLDVLTDAYFVLSQEDVLLTLDGDLEKTLDILISDTTDENGNSTTVVKKVVGILNSNPHTTPLVTALTKISVSALANQIGGASEETLALYDNVKSGVNETLAIKESDYSSREEYVGAVSDSLDTTLKENGIELERGVVDNMAEYVADNYSDVDSVSDQELNDIILSYYDSYLKNEETKAQ